MLLNYCHYTLRSTVLTAYLGYGDVSLGIQTHYVHDTSESGTSSRKDQTKPRCSLSGTTLQHGTKRKVEFNVHQLHQSICPGQGFFRRAKCKLPDHLSLGWIEGSRRLCSFGCGPLNNEILANGRGMTAKSEYEIDPHSAQRSC